MHEDHFEILKAVKDAGLISKLNAVDIAFQFSSSRWLAELLNMFEYLEENKYVVESDTKYRLSLKGMFACFLYVNGYK